LEIREQPHGCGGSALNIIVTLENYMHRIYVVQVLGFQLLRIANGVYYLLQALRLQKWFLVASII